MPAATPKLRALLLHGSPREWRGWGIGAGRVGTCSSCRRRSRGEQAAAIWRPWALAACAGWAQTAADPCDPSEAARAPTRCQGTLVYCGARSKHWLMLRGKADLRTDAPSHIFQETQRLNSCAI